MYDRNFFVMLVRSTGCFFALVIYFVVFCLIRRESLVVV